MLSAPTDDAAQRRRLVKGIAGSAALHAIVAAVVVAPMFLAPKARPVDTPPAMAIELAPAPSAPPLPPHETPPEPARPPEPQVQPEPDLPDIPRQVAAPDAVTLPTKPPPRPVVKQPPPPAPPSAPALPPKAVAAAPTQGQPVTGSATAQDNWEGQVVARLAQKKRYPAQALRNRQEDVIYVRLTVNRAGRIQSSEIVRSKGIPILEDAVRTMVERSNPLPPVPDAVPGDIQRITVPVDFFVRKK